MRARPGLSFERMAIALLFIALAFRALLMPAQNDTYWNLRDGMEILRTGHVPRADAYSFTAAGAPYTDHEWLSQVLLALGHRLAGMPGVELVAAAAVLGALALVYRLTIGPLLTRFVLLAPALSVASCVWVLRPQVFSLLAMSLLVWLIVRERWRWLPLLFLIWANAHGGVVMGGLVMTAAVAVALIRWRARGEAADARRARALALAATLSALATLCTPLGARLVPYIVLTANRSRAIEISEWAPTLPIDVLGVAFWIVALSFAAIVVVRRRALASAGWPEWALLGICGALLPVAVQSQRNMAPFLMFAAPAASRLLGADFRFRLPGRPRPPSPDHPGLNLALAGGVGLLAAVVLILAWAAPVDRLEWRPIARPALAALRACPGPLYNHYDDGGFLIWFAPDRRVFVDSRQDPYPLDLLLEHEAVERGQRSYRPLFSRYAIRCAFLPAASPTVKALAADGWATRYRDQRYAILAAPPGK
ncbi:MAG TPA: hypothetical protein VHM31_02960 [Polyangia bacterium]|nr:hypothetical protein [Polyangia bacterium]